MSGLRRSVLFRLLASLLLFSVALATFAPAVSARTGAASRIYAEWMRERIAHAVPNAVEVVLSDLSDEPVQSLDAFVDGVVRTLVREEGLAWTSSALTGQVLDSASDVTDWLLAGLQSLGSGSLPAASLSARTDAPRALPQRLDAARHEGRRSTWGDADRTAHSSYPEPVLPASDVPGRGDVQPLGP